MVYMQYMEPSFVSEDYAIYCIQYSSVVSPRAISHPRKQNSLPYIAYIPTTILYNIHIYVYYIVYIYMYII